MDGMSGSFFVCNGLNIDKLVAQWYEDKNNVDKMRHRNSALKEWEHSVAGLFPFAAIPPI